MGLELWSFNLKSFDIFKEITVGGLTKNQLMEALALKDIRFNNYAEMLFEHPTFYPPEKIERVRVVRVKLSDFELSNPFSYQEFINKATFGGLKLCPLYLGAFLRLEYLDQPVGSYLAVASLKPENNDDYPKGFYIRNYENSHWLRGYRADDDLSDWPKDNEFIFMK